MRAEWRTVQEIGRFKDARRRWPSPTGDSERERELGRWLGIQRRDYARGTIDPFRGVCLDIILGEWASEATLLCDQLPSLQGGGESQPVQFTSSVRE